jgi:hypothetical protein
VIRGGCVGDQGRRFTVARLPKTRGRHFVSAMLCFEGFGWSLNWTTAAEGGLAPRARTLESRVAVMRAACLTTT